MRRRISICLGIAVAVLLLSPFLAQAVSTPVIRLFGDSIGTFTGTAYGKGSRAYRATEPGTYWTLLAVQYLGGAFFIWWRANGMPRW
jgi:hypothetical protein